MYKNVKVKKNSKWARMILSLQQIDDISIPDEIYEMAKQPSPNMANLSHIENLNFQDKNFIQWLDDINYRTICITSDLQLTRLVQNLFLSVLATNGKNIAITSKNTENQNFILKILSYYFPDDEVVILKSKFNFESYASRNNDKRVWFLTPNPKLLIPERINETPLIFDHHFVFTHCGLSSSHRFVNSNFVSDDDLYLTGLSTEITKTTITLIFDDILEVYNYSTYAMFLIAAQKIFEANNFVISSIHNGSHNLYYNPGSLSIDNIMNTVRLKKKSFRIQNILKMGRVYFDEQFYPTGPFRFSDIELNHFISKNKSEMYDRYKFISNKILNGDTIENLVANRLANDISFSDFKTAQWYNLKCNSIFKQIFQNNLKADKTLVYTNDQKIIENIKTTQSNVCTSFDNNAKVIIIPNLSKITDELVEWADNFIIAEAPTTKFEYNALAGLEKEFGLKYSIFINKNTFEEVILNQVCPLLT